MGKLLVPIGVMIGGWAGWWVGAHIGVMTGYVLCVIGMGVGLYAVKRFLQNLFD